MTSSSPHLKDVSYFDDMPRGRGEFNFIDNSNLMMNGARLIAWALCFLALITGGCKKDASSSGAATQTNATPSDSAGAPPQTPPVRGPGPMPPAPPGPAVVSDDGGINAVLTELSLELRKY